MTFASRRTPGWNSWSATCAPVASISWCARRRPADFGVVVMVRVFVGLVIVGGRRLIWHVADDPIFQRFGNVRVVPTARTLSRWLRHFTMRTVTRFQALNAAVVRQLLPTLGLRTWTA